MPSKIEWCDETVNPQGWGCYGPGGTPESPQPCWYCYARRMSQGPYTPKCDLCRQFIPHWHPEVFDKIYRWKKPRKIFWQSMGDLLHPRTPAWQIETVLAAVKALPQHTHIFCTKNPGRYAEYNPWSGNCWLLTTITGPDSALRLIDPLLHAAGAPVLGLSMEPLMVGVDLSRWLDSFFGINWLIIGLMTGKKDLIKASPVEVQRLIDQARAAGVPVFIKGELFKQFPIQEWPE